MATRKGREFLDRAKRIVSDFEMLIQDVNAERALSESSLRIGISPASQEGLYNRIVASLLKRNPTLWLSLEGLNAERGIRLIKRGDLDLLVAPVEEVRHIKDFKVNFVETVELSLFARHDHPIFQESNISADTVMQYRLISADLESGYTKQASAVLIDADDSPSNRLLAIENFAVVSEVVAETDLIGIVNIEYGLSQSFQDRFRLIDFKVFNPLKIGVVHLSAWRPNRAARAFLHLLTRKTDCFFGIDFFYNRSLNTIRLIDWCMLHS